MAETYVAQAPIARRKYLRGRRVLSSSGRHVRKLGRDGLVIADEQVWALPPPTGTVTRWTSAR